MNKGKKKTFFRVIIMALILTMSCLCVAVSTFEPAEKIVSAVTTSSSTYSSKDGNNLVLMVEKVGVISTNDDIQYNGQTTDNSSVENRYLAYQMPLYNASGEINSIYARGGNKYYFTYIDNAQYVVGSNEFVMLENEMNGDYYYSPDLGVCFGESGGTGNSYNMAEAIMVSFGHYIYDSDSGSVTLNTDSATFAGIQQVNVTLYRNGEMVTSSDTNVLTGVRQNDTNTYQDFVYIIPQIVGETSNEGYYEFYFTYVYGGIQYSQSFGFYIIYENSYTGTITKTDSGNTNTYTAQPTLTCSDSTLTANSDGVYYYNLGTDSTNYPTLVYDYTKYKLSYTLVANGTTSTYKYTFATTTSSASLVCTTTTSGTTDSTTYYMDSYSASNTNNLVVIMFTEMGEYSLSFEYIYSGYNASNAPDMNLEVDGLALVIQGFELKYSKANYSEAQMRYVSVSTNASDGVDLIIPNGYKFGTAPSTDTLGLVYELDSTSSLRVGAVVSSKDACVNLDLISSAGSSTAYNNNVDALTSAYLEYLAGTTQNLTTTTNIISWINSVTYQKTNQGSLWFSTNDSFVLTDTTSEAGSFYLYYKSGKITFYETSTGSGEYTTKATINKYTNQTSFNTTGYYLVFIKVDPDGTNNTSDEYYQIFAFQYTTDTQSVNVNIAVADSTGDITLSGENYSLGIVVGAGEYTNQNVILSWTEPDIFERKITLTYYSVTGQYYTRAELLTTSGTVINNYTSLTAGGTTTNYALLGNNVTTGSGASFLIQLTSEGKSSSYRMFTIDREAISGVTAYAVEASTASDGTIVYQFKTASSGSYITLSSAITDTLSTLYWNSKSSGAEITATYTYTPFVKSSSVAVEEATTSASATWYTTNYTLGTTTGNFSLSRVSSLGADVSYSNVLYNQGIYIFTLTDAAGNSCKYILIIDNTEAYFKVYDGETSAFYTGSSLVYSDDVTITVSTHKAIALIPTTTDLTDTNSYNEKTLELYSFILALTDSSTAVTDLGYYAQSGTNLTNLLSLFSTAKSTAYLIVRNNSVTAYDDKTQKDDDLSATVTAPSTTINMQYEESTSTSMIRYYYLIGANQTSTSALNSNSYICIEINKDNSQGTVYYSNDMITLNGIENGNATRLVTGSDTTNGTAGEGLTGAHATSDNYVAFTWLNGGFEIASVTYTYYSLVLDEESCDGVYYYYDYKNATTRTLYSGGSYSNGAGVSTDGSTGFALINVSNSQTTAGLYMITRTYASGQDDKVISSGDKMVQTYYFIVDRNGIISSSSTINGGYIYIGLLEDETEYKSFNSYGNETGVLTYAETVGTTTTTTSLNYNIYLSSNKLPATINVTTAKYFGGSLGSDYYSGRLVFTLYFVDTYNQLINTSYSKTGGLKLFEVDSSTMSDSTAIKMENGYYVIDLTQLINSQLRSIFINSGNDSDWLCLAGDYVLVISDLVEGTTGAHQKVVGFRVKYDSSISAGPTTDVYSVTSESYTADNAYNFATAGSTSYTLTTSEEFVKIDLPTYDTTSTSAGVDMNYLVVYQSLNGVTTTYINYQYENLGGNYNLGVTEDSDAVKINADGSKTIYLDTLLRDSEGKILTDNLSNVLVYTITIRYKLSDSNGNNTAYQNAYYYYNANGTKVYYYEQTYIVYIDRVAPDANIKNLVASDNLVSYYLDDGEELFEAGFYDYYETSTKTGPIYFVNQYASYYSTKNRANIYALRVTSTTAFDKTEIYMLYYREVTDPSSISLSLPVTNYSSYTQLTISSVQRISTYGGLFSSFTTGKYFEILELDEAGNTTQYVVFYDDASGDYQGLSVPLAVTTISNQAISSTTQNFSATSLNNSSITIFSVSGNLTPEFTYSSYDMFYYFELVNAVTGTTSTLKTTMATDFTDSTLSQSLAGLVTNAGYGNYTLNIRSRYGTAVYSINYYSQDDRTKLNIDSLVSISNGNYSITLSGANVTVDNVMYYASSITVTDPNGEAKTYKYNTGDGYYYYYADDTSDGVKVDGNRLTGLSGTYMIYAVDTFGEEYYLVFNTTGDYSYYNLYFGTSESTPAGYYYTGNTYYAFSQANVYFDTSLYTVTINYTLGTSSSNSFTITSENIGTIQTTVEGMAIASSILDMSNITSGYIVVNPYFGDNGLGDVLSVTITLTANNNQSGYNHTYNLVIDTTTYAVNLRDNSTSTAQTTEISINVDYSEDGTGLATSSEAIASGNMTLSWSKYTNDYFSYTYAIFELMDDGSFEKTELNDVVYYSISTATDSTGIYNFVISIYTADGDYLGNKVYTFAVQPKTSLAYYVWDQTSIISANSSFTFAELISGGLTATSGSVLSTTLLANNLGVSGADDIPTTTNNDLYITTTDLSVWVSSDQGFYYKSYSCSSGTGYSFTVYRIYNTTNVNIYIGVLKVSETTDLISTLTMTVATSNSSDPATLNTATSLSYVYCGNTSTTYTLSFSQIFSTKNTITAKNNILIDVYYNSNFVKTVNATENNFAYTIDGSGAYSFIFRDLAGNTHEFSLNSSNIISITILREIPLTLNGMSVVDYAYFNGRVILSLTSPALYDYNSISLSATLNGSSYSPSMSSYSYTFSGYGTYRVRVSAKYGGVEITRTLVFTIINENEARTSIDFTNLNEYEITKVTNSSGRDVTDAFLSLISSTSEGGMLLTYDEVIENSKSLSITSGKQSFTVTYFVSDGVYEDREISFVFTMNDEEPTIESTVDAGDSTTKGFTITYNAGIIYDQVGEAYLYINDTLICTINASSSSSISTYTISQKTDGAGDYYVRLVSSSGNIISSFRVEVKEPLNTWAIIIIVVVTTLILAVAITIIVLRTRMRVR